MVVLGNLCSASTVYRFKQSPSFPVQPLSLLTTHSLLSLLIIQKMFYEYDHGLTFPCFYLQVRRHEQKRGARDSAAGIDSSSRHSGTHTGTGQDSGFGSDSARIRIVQIEQQSGTSHHCIARPSHKSTITKNLSFIPFDIFLTASRLSVMTYACSSPPKTLPSSSDTPSTPEKMETGDKVNKRPVTWKLSHESLLGSVSCPCVYNYSHHTQ